MLSVSCQRDKTSWYSKKQTMPCVIPPCWIRRPAHTTWHRDSKCNRTKAITIPPPFLRTSQTVPLNGRPHMACAEETWKMRCDTIHCILRELIHTPSNKPICHDLTRQSLVRLDRVRTVYGRFKYSMNLMGLSPSHQHRVSAALQARRLTTLSSTPFLRGLGPHWTRPHATAWRHAVCRIEESSIKRKKKKKYYILI